VVDGCHDGSFEFLSEWALSEPRIHVIFQENGGEAAARQRGVQEAQYDIVVLLDDDVEATEGLISAHARWHTDDVRRLVLGHMPTRVPNPRRPGQVPTILYAEDYERTCASYEINPQSILNHLWAGNMSLKRSSALDIGFTAEEPLRYHEDLRFGLRCKEAGVVAVFDRSLLAWHSHSRSLRRFATECRRSGESRAYLGRQYPELADQIDPLKSLSAREGLVVHLFGSSFARPISAPLAMATSFASGRLRSWRLEMMSARALRLIEMTYGYKRASKLNLHKTESSMTATPS
jgi:glycosyltransferase involved in cell wall biosynthesis